MPSSRTRVAPALPYLTLAGAQVAVGAAAIFARWGLSGALPLAVCAGRLSIAALILLAIAAIRQDAVRITPRERRTLGLAGMALALHFAGWIWSLEYTSVAVSTLLVATTPIWTALYDSLVRKKHLTARTWAAFVAGALGLTLLVGFNRTAAPVAGHIVWGVALSLTGALAIGAYLILVREVRTALSTRAIVTRTYSWAALALAIAALVGRQPLPARNDGVAWGGIMAMALVSQLLGHTALNAALQWFSPSAIAFTTVIEPVVAALLAFAIFHEALTPPALLGGMLVLGAVATVLREESRATALTPSAVETL
ncbi:MAG: DMT family transporter [Vulcanimicrobiaceae bacterium]